MNKKITLFLASFLAAATCPAQLTSGVPPVALNTPKHEFRYTNPITRDTAISMRDHFIIKADKKWYCVGTSEPVWTGPNPGVRLLVSEDMIHWKQHSFLIDAKKLPYSQAFEPWEKSPQMGFEPVYYQEGRFYIKGPTWTEQIIEY